MKSGECFLKVFNIKKSVECLHQKDMCPWATTYPAYVYKNITIGSIYKVSWSDSHPELYMFVDDFGNLGIVHKNNFRDSIREVRKQKLERLNNV